MKKGLGTFFVYRKFCGRTTRNGKRAKAGYHYDSGILPFALRNQVRFVRTWSSPYMARLGVVAAYVRTRSAGILRGLTPWHTDFGTKSSVLHLVRGVQAPGTHVRRKMAKFHYIGVFFHGGVWYTRLSPVNRSLTR